MKKMLKIPVKSRETATSCFARFLRVKRADGITQKTIDTYSQHFSAIGKHLDTEKTMSEIEELDLKLMILSMQESGLAANSIRSYTATLKSFFTWCNNEGITELNLKKYRAEETIKETYSAAELSLLLKKPNMKTCSFSEYRNWVIENFLVNCGCRAATVRNIQNRDVDLENRVIQARHTKNKKSLIIPLCTQMVNILIDYMSIRGGKLDDYLFPNEYGEMLTENALRCTIAKYNKRRGVQKTSIHLFRHTFAKMYLMDCGGNALMLQKLLGHSTLDMTRHYCEIFDAELTRDFDSFSPLSRLTSSSEKIKMPKRKN